MTITTFPAGEKKEEENISGPASFKELYVVGIGASAGGLEAINEFFENVPEGLEAFFVIVQHLSPP